MLFLILALVSFVCLCWLAYDKYQERGKVWEFKPKEDWLTYAFVFLAGLFFLLHLVLE